MVFDYIVYIKNERGRYINRISALLCLISAGFFLFQQFRYGRPSYLFLTMTGLIIIGVAWNLYQLLFRRQLVYYRRVLMIAGVSWIYMPFLQWLSVPIILLAFLEKHARSPLEICLTDESVVFNTLVKREFTWASLNNMLLKDGMLTIDFKNNRLFQKETSEDTTPADESEFNEYCSQHLREQKSNSNQNRGPGQV